MSGIYLPPICYLFMTIARDAAPLAEQPVVAEQLVLYPCIMLPVTTAAFAKRM